MANALVDMPMAAHGAALVIVGIGGMVRGVGGSGSTSRCSEWSSDTVTFSKDIPSTFPKFKCLYSQGVKIVEEVGMEGRAGRDQVGVAKVQPAGGRYEFRPERVK